jgi:uncharacterized membrane protein
MNKKSQNLIQIVIGIILVITSAIFILFEIFPSGIGIAFAILGIGLIAASKFRTLK